MKVSDVFLPSWLRGFAKQFNGESRDELLHAADLLDQESHTIKELREKVRYLDERLRKLTSKDNNP